MLKVTLLDVPRDVENQTMKTVLEQYGKVEEVKRHHLMKPGMEHITVNRVSVKMTREEGKELPTTIFGLGSSTRGEDRSMWRVTYPGAPGRCYRYGANSHLARDCRRPALTMKQVEKMPAIGEQVQQEDLQAGGNVTRSFAAVVKSARFIQQEEELVREAERQKQESLARKIIEDRRKAEEEENRVALKEAEDARKNKDAEEKRALNLARLAEVSNQASQYKEKVRVLHEKAQKEMRETRSYEKQIEELTDLTENPPKRPRPPMSPGAASTAPQES